MTNPHGPTGAPARPATLDVHEALAAIGSGRVRVLTSDVFDTLLWRPVAEPRHLFLELARRCRAAGWLHDWVDDRTFAVGREQSEHDARRAALVNWGAPECTLEEIWERLPAAWWARGVGPGPSSELDVEGDALRLHPTATGLLAAARQREIPIVLVSDTYFSVEQLGGLAAGSGLDLDGVEIVTSSSRRRNKWDGLLADVLAEHGGTHGALHLGDNPDADVEAASRLGVDVCHVGLHDDDDAVPTAHEPWIQLSRATGSDAGRDAAVRETLVASGARAHDPSYQFGVAVAGPIMAGFAGWVSATADELGAGTVHCLLREGQRIAELIDVVRPDGPPRVLVHASRWAIMRAAVIDATADELELALARRSDLRAEHVAEAFGCDADEVAAVIGGHTVPRERRLDAYAALAEHDALRTRIVESAAGQRRNALVYLRKTLRLDDGPLVLADVGWGGTIQEGLTTILRDAGIDTEVIGLYALLSPPGEHRAGRGARLRGYLPTVGASGVSTPHAEAAIRHPEFLERINTPAIGTLLAFDDDGEPVTRPDDHDVINDSLRLAQQGVTDFCSTLAATALADPRRRDEWFHAGPVAAAALEGLASVIRGPDPRIAAALGSWQHDDVAGTAAEELSSTEFRRWVPYANAVDAAEITMHDVFWVPGVAGAARSSLSEQLEALARGAHPDTICPPSPTGLARIAAFPPGSDLASAQTEVVPRLGTAGWMLLQLSSPVPGLRSIRIDIGATDVLVDVADVRIVVGHGDTETTLVDGTDSLRAGATWLGGRWLDARRAVVASGGHLLVDPPDELVDTIRWVSVSIGARAWPVEPATVRGLFPRWRAALDPVRRRVTARLRRH